MSPPTFDADDPLFKPLTLAQVLEITERSRRTVERWVKDHKLTAYEEAHRRTVVFNEDEVLEVEQKMAAAARENRERIRARAAQQHRQQPGDETTT